MGTRPGRAKAVDDENECLKDLWLVFCAHDGWLGVSVAIDSVLLR